jgi:polar amino acid transport system substrate-binding protein
LAGTPDEYFGLCVKQGNTELQSKLNKVLDEMKADGSLSKIYVEIFGMDLSDSIK